MMAVVRKGRGFKGEIKIPGDKSISHRALLIASLASGRTEIENLLPAKDCLATVSCLRKMGVEIEMSGGRVKVEGKGLFGFEEPREVLDAENSGTTARLLLGILVGQGFFSVLTGDSSLRKRPMGRVVDPLRRMGAQIDGREGGDKLPLGIRGGDLKGVRYRLPLPSAQVKSALILAGLLSDGMTEIEEPIPSRDHTERMLKYFGADIERRNEVISVLGKRGFSAQRVVVPGDFSSASFFITAALLVEGSEIVLPDVGVNPTRIGFLKVVERMGARIALSEERTVSGEPVATISVSTSPLRGVKIEKEEVPTLIDEIPLVALLATQAKGRTVISGASELRVKESDRLSTLAFNLRRMGVELEEREDGLIVEGPQRLNGGSVRSFGDHRIAMTLAIGGLIAEGETEIEGFECYKISFPNFYSLLKGWEDG